MYLQDFRKEIFKTLKEIKNEKKNDPTRDYEDIIQEKIVHLLTYFSKDYDESDIHSMYEVFDFYITALKHIFFPSKKIANMYRSFYIKFKLLMNDNIYQASGLRILLSDICKFETKHIPNADKLKIDNIVSLYYHKVIIKKDFYSSIHDFVLAELRKGNNIILDDTISQGPGQSSESPLITSSTPSPLPLPSQGPDSSHMNRETVDLLGRRVEQNPLSQSRMSSPQISPIINDSPMASIGTPESLHIASPDSTGSSGSRRTRRSLSPLPQRIRRRSITPPRQRRNMTTPPRMSRRRQHARDILGIRSRSASSGSASSGMTGGSVSRKNKRRNTTRRR